MLVQVALPSQGDVSVTLHSLMSGGEKNTAALILFHIDGKPQRQLQSPHKQEMFQTISIPVQLMLFSVTS